MAIPPIYLMKKKISPKDFSENKNKKQEEFIKLIEIY